MFKKSIIRLTLVVLVGMAGILVLSAKRSQKAITCSEGQETREDGKGRSNSEIVIWETLNKTILCGVHY